MLGHFGKRLNAFFELWIFFNFFEIFRRLNPPWNSGKKLFLPKKAPKHVWTLGNNLDNLRTLNFFWFFFLNLFCVSTSNFKSGKPNSNFSSPENWPHIFKSRKSEKPCMEHSAKKHGENASKHVQNTFGHFWKRLCQFWNFENVLIFFQIFQNPTLHGTRGNFFSKKMPQNMFKTSLDIFGNNSGLFCSFEFSLIFLRKLSMTPWNTGQKTFRKIRPKTRLDTFENEFRHFWNFETSLIFFFNFCLSLYLKI